MLLKYGLPPLFNCTVTIYNKCCSTNELGRTEVTWKRYVLNNAYFISKRAEARSDKQISNDDTFECLIPKTSKYIDSLNFNNNSSGFTLKPGDIVIKGFANDLISDEKGHRITDLLEKYSYSFTIRKFSDNTGIGFGEHYYVSGV